MKRRPQIPEDDLFTYAASASASPTAREVKPAPEPVAETVINPVAEQAAKTIAESIPELRPEAKAATKVEPKAAPETKPAPVAVPVPALEPVGEKLPEISPATFLPVSRARHARSLVVSIHDVSPMTQETTAQILAELAEIGVHQVALLVVPNHHCKGHFLDYPEFCHWLREQARSGHEIAVHGYHHRRDQRPGETFRQKVATQYYTAGEGEFYDIAGADALRIVSQARQEFRKIGIDPHGFVAPAWLLSDGADRALQRLGVGYTTRIGGLFDYTTGVQHHSQSLVWSTRSAWRRGLSLLWNAYLFRRLKSTPLLRIGIHPPDFAHRAVWKQIKTLATRALKDREATTYARYLNLK